jgi:CSLREA domain-containing protein
MTVLGRRIAMLTVAAAGLTMLLGGVAQAATFTVNSLADPGDGTCNVANCTLHEAIDAANADSAPDTVNISVTGTLGLVGPLPLITNPMAIAGPGASQLNLRRTVPAAFRILSVYGNSMAGAKTVSISGLTVSNGRAEVDFAGLPGPAGGGIASWDAALTLDDVVITGNTAITAYSAGGLYSSADGGGLFVNSGQLTLRNTVISSNTATASSSDATVNAVATGGGISLAFVSPITMDRSTVRDNTITGLGGATPYVNGGGILVQPGGIADVVTITNSTISGNHAGDLTGPSPGSGGGISNLGTLSISNSTVSGNRADDYGGGIDTFAGGCSCSPPATTSINSVTIASNAANADGDGIGGGGGTHSGTGPPSGTSATNTLYYGNTATGADGGPQCGGWAHISGGYNLLSSAAGCGGFTGPGDIVNNTFLLGALANNGGPTLTHALPAGAAALNAGNPATPGSGAGACPAADQRGISRSGTTGRCDIGAYELVPPPAPPTLTSTNPVSGSNNNSPKVIGTALTGTTVKLYTNATCTSAIAATGTAAAFASPGLTVTVADNTSTTFHATTTNSDGTSACSTGAITYNEVTPPPPPTLTSTNPPSGSNDNSPKIIGAAAAGGTVKLYANATCTGTPAATGTAAGFVSPGLTVSVPDNSSTTFHATTTVGNGTSACSTSSLTYNEVTPPPATGVLGQSSPTGLRAAALKKCKKKHGKKRKACKRAAMRLPL